MRRGWVWGSVLAVVVTAAVAGCGGSGGGSDDKAAPEQPASSTTEKPAKTKPDGGGEKKPDALGPTTEFVTVRDPVNNAFSVDVPKGWDNLAYSTGEAEVHREVVNSVSPDGRTVIFMGDPKIPNYWNPDMANPITVQFAEWSDYMQLERYVPAGTYVLDYAQKKFGKLDDFLITDMVDNDATEQGLREAFVNAGLPEPNTEFVDLHFSYTGEDGVKMRAVLILGTVDNGAFWQAMVSGISTDGDPADYRKMLRTMAASAKTNPDWTAQQQARHEATMAEIQRRTQEMTQQHQANMQWIQDSANRHQARMQAIWSANDASMSSFYDRMDAMDTNQRGFLNYINEENTVVTSSGQQFQVDNSYQTYYLNPDTGKYVGGDINFNESSIRELGLNPNDYEEVKVTG